MLVIVKVDIDEVIADSWEFHCSLLSTCSVLIFSMVPKELFGFSLRAGSITPVAETASHIIENPSLNSCPLIYLPA